MNRFERDTFDSSTPGGPSREQVALKISPIITPETLKNDNDRKINNEAHDRISDWDIHRYEGKHVVVATCGDARLEIPRDRFTERIHTIASGGPKDPYADLFKSINSNAIVSLAHHDGDTVKPGEMPTGCGGLGLKAEIKKSGKRGGNRTENFVDTGVHHEDALIQACATALDIAELTDKPVLAATQDHLTGLIHPLLAFWTEGSTTRISLPSSISIRDLTDPIRYDHAELYKKGIPSVDILSLPKVFQEYLQANQDEIKKLHNDFPNYRELQKIQNPRTAILTTDIRPTRLKYPTLFEELNSFFRLTIPRLKDVSGEDVSLSFEDEELERVFEQMQFPIDEFDKLQTIVVETSNLKSSKMIAEGLRAQPFMDKWNGRPGNNIIVVESRGGKIWASEYLQAAA